MFHKNESSFYVEYILVFFDPKNLKLFKNYRNNQSSVFEGIVHHVLKVVASKTFLLNFLVKNVWNVIFNCCGSPSTYLMTILLLGMKNCSRACQKSKLSMSSWVKKAEIFPKCSTILLFLTAVNIKLTVVYHRLLNLPC